jgi:hypothetical protein
VRRLQRLFVLMLVALPVVGHAGATLHFWGLTRQTEACWRVGDKVVYEIAGRRYEVPAKDLTRVDGQCEDADGTTLSTLKAGDPNLASSGQMSLTPPAATSARYGADGSESYSGHTASVSSSGPSSSDGTVYVKGYTRKDGTYVRPHTRSAPGSGGGRRR